MFNPVIFFSLRNEENVKSSELKNSEAGSVALQEEQKGRWTKKGEQNEMRFEFQA